MAIVIPTNRKPINEKLFLVDFFIMDLLFAAFSICAPVSNVGADLCVCPGATANTGTGADTQVCPYIKHRDISASPLKNGKAVMTG
jgi:hypothetical protein